MDDTIKLNVNGQDRQVTTDPGRPLLDVLREDLALTGTKYGCGEGRCGACTVLLDGKRIYSCRTGVGQAAGKPVRTVEGLAPAGAGKLHPVQEAFVAADAFQCGYCTPGMVMAAVALLEEKPNPTDEEIGAWMNRQVCRCCGYPRIVEAVKRAAEAVAGAGGGAR
jgi:aerobic-type carbon monoxide dehydrogenase small subunit (CoxS/CutS family)